MASRKAASIDAESTVVTLINVYEVERERQAELAGLLAEATEKVMRHQPGFVSVNIHCSFDGARVVNYAQWASKDDFDRLMKSPEAQIVNRRPKLPPYRRPILTPLSDESGR